MGESQFLLFCSPFILFQMLIGRSKALLCNSHFRLRVLIGEERGWALQVDLNPLTHNLNHFSNDYKMTTSLPDYHQQSQSNQSQMQTATPTGNYNSNNPFLNAQPTGASIQSTATAPPSFNEAINDANNRIPTSEPHPISAQNTSNPFDDLSTLEQHLNTSSTDTSQLNSSSNPSGIDSRVTNQQIGTNHQVPNRTPSPPISPIESQSPRHSTSPPSSPEVQSHQRPQTPPLIIPPDVDSPPDPSSTSTTTAVYNPPSEPPPPVSTSSSTPITYQPPPNPPPRHPHGRTTSNSSSSHANPSMNNGSTQDTWRPTTIPTPGQPLLRDGRILVYPAGFHCPKCEYVDRLSF